MIHDYNNKYLENLHFDEARAIFMMLTWMIVIKSNYKNIECETCNIEENTLHLFKCKKAHKYEQRIQRKRDHNEK